MVYFISVDNLCSYSAEMDDSYFLEGTVAMNTLVLYIYVVAWLMRWRVSPTQLLGDIVSTHVTSTPPQIHTNAHLFAPLTALFSETRGTVLCHITLADK